MREAVGKPDPAQPIEVRHLKTAHQSKGSVPEALGLASAGLARSSHSNSSVVVPTIPPPPMSFVLRDCILQWLQKNVPISRLQHILRVEQMSVELANQHGIDQNQAAQAGLMHDLAKFFKPQRLLQMAQADGLTLDPVELANPHLLHAAVGAIVARDEFGIQDVAVLDAIRHHTLGCPGMSALSCVVFLADSLEPGRGDTPVLEALRQSSQQDLYQAVWHTCDESLRHLVSRAQLIHPRMVLTRNWALSLSHPK